MTSPPFRIGDEGELGGGFDYRVRQGRKGPDDMILDLRGSEHWSPACMDVGFLLADFFFQNEDRLYPRAYGFDGGDRYLNAVLASARRGWRQTLSDLNVDKERRRRRNGAHT